MPDPTPQDTLYIRQGTDLVWPYPCDDADTGLAADFTGWNARCEVKTFVGGPIVTRFHSDGSKGWDGTVTFDGVGNLILGLTATQTAALTRLPRSAKFDLELISPTGVISRLVSGPAVVTLEVTTDG